MPYVMTLWSRLHLLASQCGIQVGYKFCADLTPSKRNLHQIGRYGLVCSTFRAAPLGP